MLKANRILGTTSTRAIAGGSIPVQQKVISWSTRSINKHIVYIFQYSQTA
jgi:hypothetical protein